jgi:phosphoglycerol transferase MdoB-like AlkP superfamily enzyme
MTLGDFFNKVNEHPMVVLAFFVLVPLLSLLVGLLSGKKAGETPWTSIQSGLIYVVAAPAVFAVMLTFYLFFFERRSIFDTNIITQVVPVLSLAQTLLIIRRFVPLKFVPGFNKIGDLLAMLALIFGVLWILDRTRIFVFTMMPFQYILIGLVAMVVLVRFFWRRLS